MADALASLTRALVGRYAIEEPVGEGGMAWVFAATDQRHHRRVAIKVLRPELASVVGADRFLREIRTSAGLRHPHIVPLFDSGEAEGFLYYVMPLVEGGTLRTRIDREGPLPLDEALRLAGQVADALAYAHRRGIVHRDVKPENVLLEGGHALVTDFGIARALDVAPDSAGSLTRAGLVLGTPKYISPEQLSSDGPLDGRSDLYSLACVLYEMLAGRPPFTAERVDRLYVEHLIEPPPPVTNFRPATPPAVSAALERALAKDPVDRFPTTTAFTEALASASGASTPDPRSVAVLPFVSLGADPENEYFADGMTEDVIAQLSRIRALKVVSRTSVMAFKGGERSLREIADRLQVAALLEGSVRRAGSRVRIVAQLIDAETDQHLWAETFDRDLTDIFAIQTEVALRIAEALEAELSPAERTRIDRRQVADPRAYQLLLLGRHHFIRFTPEGLKRSIHYFEQAIERDEGYAAAWSGLAMAYTELVELGALEPEEPLRRAKAAAERALALDGDLAEAHCTVAYVRMVYEFDWVGAENEFRRAIELSPGHADAYALLGRLEAGLGRYEDAIRHSLRAQELDPLAHRVDVATAFLRAGRNEEALEYAGRAVEFDGSYPRALATLGWAYLRTGATEVGLEHLERAAASAPDSTSWVAQLGQAYALAGHAAEARAVLDQLLARSRTGFVAPYHLAYVLTGLGQHDEAIEQLERAFEQRAGAMYGVKGSFLFEGLRSHPRFLALLSRMKLG